MLGLGRGQVLGLARDDQQVHKGNNTAAQADTDRADNMGLDTVSCKPPLMPLCKQDANLSWCPCKGC